jgi:hypothetical protein
VWWPAYLRDHLLPWRIAGWSSDFYGGFPAGQFYFPVPALLILALDLVAPYNVAFKLGTVAGAAFLPVGAYVFARGIRAPRPTPALSRLHWFLFHRRPGTGAVAEYRANQYTQAAHREHARRRYRTLRHVRAVLLRLLPRAMNGALACSGGVVRRGG